MSYLCKGIVVVALFFHVAYLMAAKTQDNSLADIAWGMGFVLFATVLYHDSGLANLLFYIVILAWGVRLTAHIGLRSIDKAEDYRYQAMREAWSSKPAWQSYWRIFLLQMLLCLVISMPIALVLHSASSLGWSLPGLLIALAGLIIEAVADWQLNHFCRHNTGKLCDVGLWRWSRHPNYLGEAIFWWGIALVALHKPWGWLGLISALLITLLLRYVSGVPLLEKRFATRPGFAGYCAKTPIFLPFKLRK